MACGGTRSAGRRAPPSVRSRLRLFRITSADSTRAHARRATSGQPPGRRSGSGQNTTSRPWVRSSSPIIRCRAVSGSSTRTRRRFLRSVASGGGARPESPSNELHPVGLARSSPTTPPSRDMPGGAGHRVFQLAGHPHRPAVGGGGRHLVGAHAGEPGGRLGGVQARSGDGCRGGGRGARAVDGPRQRRRIEQRGDRLRYLCWPHRSWAPSVGPSPLLLHHRLKPALAAGSNVPFPWTPRHLEGWRAGGPGTRGPMALPGQPEDAQAGPSLPAARWSDDVVRSSSPDGRASPGGEP